MQASSPGAWASTHHTWAGSSTLLLRKLRELARFILRGKEGQDVPMVELGKVGKGIGVGLGREADGRGPDLVGSGA